ncbi:MAG: zinc ribbon domain-containing protein [Veillonella sp.]|nr:zinc ribbon domain-containing protein [Veillonella sp.]
MSLINCPSCGKTISDKAPKCPHCGFNLASNNINATQHAANDNLQINTYGNTTNERPWYKNPVVCIIGVVACLIFVSAIGFGGYFAYDKFFRSSYYDEDDVAERYDDREEDNDEADVSTEWDEGYDDIYQHRGQSNIERNQNFQTSDLATFMVHGKVKNLTVHNKDNSSWVYSFGEDGRLTSVVSKRGDKVFDGGIKVSHNNGNIILRYTYGSSEYEVDSDMRIRKHTYEAGKSSYVYTYSNFDSNGWPLEMNTASYNSGELKDIKTQVFRYSDIDEYGNWRSNGENIRTIEYYH